MPSTRPLRSLPEVVGAATLSFFDFLGGLGLMVKDSLRFLVLGLIGRRGVPRRTFFAQAARSGPHSLLVVLLVNFFIGLILALIGGKILIMVGFKQYIGNLMGLGMFLELGPLLTAIIMTGYIGAAYTAEISSMVVNEETRALRTMAVNPIRVVAAPRVLAVMLMVPMVTLAGDAIGLFGGLLVSKGVLEIGPQLYWDQVWSAVRTEDVMRGVIKSVVFGLIIGSVGCYKGFRVRGGAEGVGRATTSSVVTTIIAIVIADAILTYLMLFRS